MLNRGARARAAPRPPCPPPPARDELAAEVHQTRRNPGQGHPLKLLSVSSCLSGKVGKNARLHRHPCGERFLATTATHHPSVGHHARMQAAPTNVMLLLLLMMMMMLVMGDGRGRAPAAAKRRAGLSAASAASGDGAGSGWCGGGCRDEQATRGGVRERREAGP